MNGFAEMLYFGGMERMLLMNIADDANRMENRK
jgi:hypothetical protein